MILLRRAVSVNTAPTWLAAQHPTVPRRHRSSVARNRERESERKPLGIQSKNVRAESTLQSHGDDRPSGSNRLSRRSSVTYRVFNNLRQELLKPVPKRGHGGKSKSLQLEKYRTLHGMAVLRLQHLFRLMGPWTAESSMWAPYGFKSDTAAAKESKLFGDVLDEAFRMATENGVVSRADNPLFWKLRNSFINDDVRGLGTELKHNFLSYVLRSRFSKAATARHVKLADFRYPWEWFPAARALKRTVHLHVGPTNSGKTYRALKALESAKTGIYAGPLRLLAYETYSRLRAKGLSCSLVTGDDVRFPDGNQSPAYTSCTVEMTALDTRVDVAVIDEIQMIADDERGWAWTNAFLGVQARDVHLCGEERAVAVIQKLCQNVGEECIVHRYQRLSPLQVANSGLNGKIANLRKGDAIVAFSRQQLHVLKTALEEQTGRRCAIIYGSLPPETRAEQARLFNDPDNDCDFLVASDAIGMGLNLEIKRIVFESVGKWDVSGYRKLAISEVRQIGGRAGRFRTAYQATSDPRRDDTSPPMTMAEQKKGIVTTLDDEELPTVRHAFTTEAEQLQVACIEPPSFIIHQFARYFPPETPLIFLLLRLRDLARTSSLFKLMSLKVAVEVAEVIQPFDMTLADRLVFLHAPVSNLRDARSRSVVEALARCLSEMRSGHLLDIEEIDLEVLDVPASQSLGGEHLLRLEAAHKAIILYIWLSYRYIGVYVSQSLAFHVKSLLEHKIEEALGARKYDEEKARSRKKRLQSQAKLRAEREEILKDESDQMRASGEVDLAHNGQDETADLPEQELVAGRAPADEATSEKANGNSAIV
jgi:ATP-dependent RNA helicase SUPV3L1/SUV3